MDFSAFVLRVLLVSHLCGLKLMYNFILLSYMMIPLSTLYRTSCFFPRLPSGHNCEFLPCEASNPCENGAVCVEELDQDHFPLGFRCRCRRGFDGPRCEINVNECSSSPCLHGFCYDGKKLPICACTCGPGWTGVDCACASGPCQNGGSCVDLIDKFACFCPDGYTGKTCEIDIDVCVEAAHNITLCFNGGTCVDGKGSNFTCR
uniref:EGF-like domain-containing protein n=1 Tax=Periophthalmus magnuspinnatus TaxID=409849 RepID=A0A3B4A1K6_9GOBI